MDNLNDDVRHAPQSKITDLERVKAAFVVCITGELCNLEGDDLASLTHTFAAASRETMMRPNEMLQLALSAIEIASTCIRCEVDGRRAAFVRKNVSKLN